MSANSQRTQSSLLCPLLANAFAELERAAISYCVLRGYDDLLAGAVDGDIDLLVAPEQMTALVGALERCGFVALDRWGQTPHHFFVGYDEFGDRWIKLDIVTELTYGRPVPMLKTRFAAACLANRRRYGPIFAPSVEDELLNLLLHCLLDKESFTPVYQAQLTALANAISNEQYIAAHVAACFPPPVTWARLKQAITHDEWSILLNGRRAVALYLARPDPLGTQWRRISRPLLRFLDRRTRSLRTRGLAIALLAPDGAGKTTLAHALGQRFFLPTRYIYMGTNLNSGGVTLPTTRWLAKIGSRGSQPFVRILKSLNTIIEQVVRYRLGAYHRKRGRLVIFDRYITSSLGDERGSGPIHKRARRWIMRQLCPAPDMVIYLDAPAEVLYQRKGEHSPEILEQQRQHYLRLLRGLPQSVVVDAGQPADQVRRFVAAMIWRRYTGSGQTG